MALGMAVGLSPGNFVSDMGHPFPKKGAEAPLLPPPKKKSARVNCGLWPVSWMNQDDTWHGSRPQPGDFVLDGDPAPSPKRVQRPPPQFSPDSIVAKRLDASKCQLVWR